MCRLSLADQVGGRVAANASEGSKNKIKNLPKKNEIKEGRLEGSVRRAGKS